MTIRFTCAECASVLKIKDELAGTSGRCPKCKTNFVVPMPQPDHELLPQSEEAHSQDHESRSENGTRSGDEHVTEDNLDCPPILLLVHQSPVRAATSPLQSHRSEKSSFAADKEFFSAQPTLPPPRVIEAFDPSKFLIPDPPPVTREETREVASAYELRDENPELSLSDDSDIDLEDRPEPRPISRPTPAVSVTRQPPEKIDLATAAKMMKKAIKDNQAAEAHQREIDANAGFDYGEIFREFGLKGLGILAGGILASFLLYYVSSRMYSGSLHLPKLGYVTGVVKLDGQPLSGAMVYFSPNVVDMDGAKRDRIRTSVGVADPNGNYRMMYVPGDRIEGVAVGECLVWVEHIGKTGRSDVPPEWTEAAMHMKEVTPGRQKVPFEINMQSRAK